MVFMTALGRYLPGEPVPNDRIEDHIGHISDEATRRGRLALRQNKIKTRYYAMRADGMTDFTVARLSAEAIRDMLRKSEIGPRDVDFLAASTTQNDVLVPGIASGVHGELKLPPMEIASHQSVCASSLMAMKNAFLHVKAGESRAAVACGAEFSSRYFRPGFYVDTPLIEADGSVGVDADFLRWTLSDGAGAALFEPKPNERGLSLKVEWIELRSFADRFENCMTGGVIDGARGEPRKPWSHAASAEEAFRSGAMALRQDFETLYAMLPVWVSEFMRLVDAGRIVIDQVDWFLCHFSAHSLRLEIEKLATKAGCMIPAERWFTNLYEVGNVGSASVFLLLHDLLAQRALKHGQKILCAVPESGRCIMGFMLLTVCEAGHG